MKLWPPFRDIVPSTIKAASQRRRVRGGEDGQETALESRSNIYSVYNVLTLGYCHSQSVHGNKADLPLFTRSLIKACLVCMLVNAQGVGSTPPPGINFLLLLLLHEGVDYPFVIVFKYSPLARLIASRVTSVRSLDRVSLSARLFKPVTRIEIVEKHHGERRSRYASVNRKMYYLYAQVREREWRAYVGENIRRSSRYSTVISTRLRHYPLLSVYVNYSGVKPGDFDV